MACTACILPPENANHGGGHVQAHQTNGRAPARCSRRFAARAQTWPSGPIRIVVPFPAGGSVDAMARLAQAGLQQRLGVTIVVENRSGASGSTGTAIVAKSPPDGNTWLLTFDNHAVNPVLLPNYPFDNQKDLEPVTLVGTAPYMVATNPAKPYKTLADVIAAAKKSSRQDQLRLGRQRQHRASGDGAARQAGRDRHHPCPLSRRRAGGERCDRRPHRPRQRQRRAA